MRVTVIALALTSGTSHARPLSQAVDSLPALVRACLWSDDPHQSADACATIRRDTTLAAVSRTRFHDLESILRAGRPPGARRPLDLRSVITVALPDGRSMPLILELPSRYTDETAWPLLLAMHGGPPSDPDGARRSAERMVDVWSEAADAAGWVIAAPVMTTVVAAGPRTDDRLPYDILRPAQALAAIDAVQQRVRIDPNRVVSTGISLGSNFSIAFASAIPDRFAAIVPVSTEGDSREHVLRGLQHVPVYVLEGAGDQNIRAIAGPRALRTILISFGYDVTYREFGDRAHEGFAEHYPDVLRWLADRPRQVYPRDVLRVPHSGIVPPDRRRYWIESDTRQALVHACVSTPDNRIDITARWARRLRVYLHDRLVDLDRPVEIRVNGIQVERRRVDRSIAFAVDQVAALHDPGRVFAARLDVEVPPWEASVAEGQRLWAGLAPRQAEGPLSFWEMYALRALEERAPPLGLEGDLVSEFDGAPLPGEQRALRLTRVSPGSPFARAGLQPDDVLRDLDGEPFFADRGLGALHAWILREIDARPRDYRVRANRDGLNLSRTVTLSLGGYRK